MFGEGRPLSGKLKRRLCLISPARSRKLEAAAARSFKCF
jgi:hypothetical protein